MTRVLYPGSFDPITKGHMNIIEQASELFDEVIVAILRNPAKKNQFFTEEERLDMLNTIYSKINNVKVVLEKGAAVDVAELYQCKAIIRGLRSLSDYDYEVQLHQINKELSNNKVNTVFLFADKEYQFLSSTIVKEVLNLDKPIDKYVHPYVKMKMYEKRKEDNYE